MRCVIALVVVLPNLSCSSATASMPGPTEELQEAPPLRLPKLICSQDGLLKTKLVIELKDWIFDEEEQRWKLATGSEPDSLVKKLRTYDSPKVDEKDCTNQSDELEWTIPAQRFALKRETTLDSISSIAWTPSHHLRHDRMGVAKMGRRKISIRIASTGLTSPTFLTMDSAIASSRFRASMCCTATSSATRTAA